MAEMQFGSAAHQAVATETLDRLAAIMRRTFRNPHAEIAPATTAHHVDGWDSLSHAMLLMNMEREFDIRLDPAEVVELADVAALVGVIEQAIAFQHAPARRRAA